MFRHPSMTKIAILLAAFVFCGAGHSACAQATIMALGGENEMPVVRISSVSQAEPDPPLKYLLTPAYGKPSARQRGDELLSRHCAVTT